MNPDLEEPAKLPTATAQPPNARPWEADDLLPEAPSPGTYGFVAGKKTTTCTLADLLQTCSAVQIPDVALVWTPGDPRMVPMTEVPELQPAMSSRLKSGILLNVWGLPLGALFYWIDPKRGAFILLVFVVAGRAGTRERLFGAPCAPTAPGVSLRRGRATSARASTSGSPARSRV